MVALGADDIVAGSSWSRHIEATRRPRLRWSVGGRARRRLRCRVDDAYGFGSAVVMDLDQAEKSVKSAVKFLNQNNRFRIRNWQVPGVEGCPAGSV